MGASNFQGMGEFGIWAYIEEYNPQFYEEAYPESEGYTEQDRARAFEEDCEFYYRDKFQEIQAEIDKLNPSLDFHKLGVESGYYEGMEIVLLERPESDDPETLAYILNDADNARIPFWNYGDSAKRKNYQKKARIKYIEEFRRIDEWLNTVAFDLGFREYGVVSRFSNGETWYNEVKGQRKEAPVNANEYFFNQDRKGLLSRFKGKKPITRKPLINLRRR